VDDTHSNHNKVEIRDDNPYGERRVRRRGGEKKKRRGRGRSWKYLYPEGR